MNTIDDKFFYNLVGQAAFANPFSDQRREADLQLTGLAPHTPATELQMHVATAVTRRIAQLEEHKKADIRLYRNEDRQLLLNAFLFDVYHRFLPAFDKLITDQIREGETHLPVPFSRDVLTMLINRGCSTERARHFFSGFYQMRRAYYLISQNLRGDCPSMKTLRSRLWTNLFTTDIRWYEQFLWNRMEDFSTLLLGETGTGKGSAAAAIGRSGYIPFDEKRRCFTESFTSAFLSINLSQFSASLLESELFGHKKGAFTGAIDHHTGVFARCSPHGAIFLDEIGDVSIPIQIKLLHILQERTFSPVGSHDKLRFQGRVIAATNRSLDELRQRNEFRNDFYYRLCSDVITVPPLRQRLREDPNEMKLLLNHLLRRMIGSEVKELVDSVHEILNKHPGPDYAWPGNVRELEQAVRRILLTKKYEGDIGIAQQDLRSQLIRGIDTAPLNAETLLSIYCALLYQQHGTYEKVSELTQLDRRTAKKYILQGIST